MTQQTPNRPTPKIHLFKKKRPRSTSRLFQFKTTLMLVSLSILSVVGCSRRNESSDTKAIIGTDDRLEIHDRHLLAKVGLLNVGDHNCNATLIAPDTIVTVVHCVDEKKAAAIDHFTFVTASGKIAKVAKLLALDTKKDLAIYKLDANNFDFFKANFQSENGQKISVAGYDTARGKWLLSSCKVKSKSADTASFTYDCDTVPGMSGSAVLHNGQVIGLHVAFDEDSKQNLAIDFASINNPSGDLSKRPRLNMEWPPCICCRGCSLPKLPSLDDFKDGMMNQLKNLAAAAVGDESSKNGWTHPQCIAGATGIVTSVTTPAYATICSAVGLSTGGTGIPPCLAWIAGTTATVVSLACQQACVDGKINRDCP